MTTRIPYSGPAILSGGFRPFFFLAITFASVSVLLWMAIYQGAVSLSGPFQPVDWHIHEMLFGYTSAVLTGFLFTAIPNWTGRMPVQGWPLGGLAVLWIAGRLSVAGVGNLPAFAVLAIDCGFLGAVVAMILREIVAGRNWRNLIVVAPVLMLLFANILFHFEVIYVGISDYGRRMGFAVVIFLIMLIGGRIIPSFTRNWLVKNRSGRFPTPFNRFDKFCLLVAVIGLGVWVILPTFLFTSISLIGISTLHCIRLLRWQGVRTTSSLLLFMLHIAYAAIPVGLLLLGLGAEIAGLHVLGIGAVGGMTLAVMIRATLGHTGRALTIRWDLGAAFLLVIGAAVMRTALFEISDASSVTLWAAAVLWSTGFGIALVRVGVWLWTPKVDRRKPS